MPPLLADLIHARGCKLKCEKFLTLPGTDRLACFLCLNTLTLILLLQPSVNPFVNSASKVFEMPLAQLR